MGDVVAFRPPAGPSKRNRSGEGPKGIVVLFTGVRYERHDEAPEREATSPARRKPRRRA